MKFLDDILQSISGNTKTKVDDPFIGAFIGSWIVCNWNHLAILIWGDGTTKERINALSTYLKETDALAFNTIIVIPLLMTTVFLFAFPWASLFLKSIQKFANDRLHQQAISIEVNKTKQQEALNRQKLLADPDKKFLEQNVQLDIDRRKEIIEQLKLRSVKLKENAEAAAAASEAAAAAATEAKSRAKQAQLEEEKKQQNSVIERQRFTVASARLKAAQASNRFPASYSFMHAIEESLKADGVQLSLAGLGEIVAIIFGYKNFQSLVFDENFNNEKLSQVKFIYYDPAGFASSLENIVQDEGSDNEDLTPDLLFDHVISIFDNSEYKLITEDQVEEVCRDIGDKHKYDLLQGEELSGLIAESDTEYDEIEIGDLESITFDDGLKVLFSGSASGTHRKEHDVPGRDIGFSIEIKNTLLLGTRALGEFEIGEVTGSFLDYYSEDEDDAEAH
jgi:ribosomal protein L12E/L44/L45/RPP1/RPP2